MKPIVRNYSIPPDVDQELRRAAFEDERSRTSIVVEGLRMFLARRAGEEIPATPDRVGS